MAQNKVVVQFQDGTILKGETVNFSPNKEDFHLMTQEGKTVAVDFKLLKAVFFVKDFKGDKNYKELYDDFIAGGGRKVKVTFNDGEVLIGFAQVFNAKHRGFNLIPADKKSNNERIYILSSATKGVEVI